jgi:poly(A) polymerase
VAPEFCTREMFFSSLKSRLLSLPQVSKLNAVEGARVPLIELIYQGVPIDLLFARLPTDIVPEDPSSFLDDNILLRADPVTVSTLNGPRTTELIMDLVGRNRQKEYVELLRCIRKWAKSRGLYGNSQGYLGGINCNILAAFICQLYPAANSSMLLQSFFTV